MADAPMINGDATAEALPTAPASESAPPEVGYCLKCGYDMRGLGVQRCPECGTAFDAQEARAFTAQWALTLRRRLRVANVVSAIGCVIALLYLLTGIHVVLAAAIVMGLAFLTYNGVFLFYYLLCWIAGTEEVVSRLGEPNAARVGVWNCSRTGLVALLLIVTACVAIRSGSIGAFLPAAVGLGMLGWQIRVFAEGRSRGYMLCLPESISESIRFAVGLSKFISVVSFILLAALLSVR